MISKDVLNAVKGLTYDKDVVISLRTLLSALDSKKHKAIVEITAKLYKTPDGKGGVKVGMKSGTKSEWCAMLESEFNRPVVWHPGQSIAPQKVQVTPEVVTQATEDKEAGDGQV